jgi:hypothetical protein
MSDDKIVARTLLHACHVPNTGHGKDAVVISEIIENDKGEVRPNLRIFRSPNVSFWVTQEPYRIHNDKKEFEDKKRLDEFSVPHATKDEEIHFALYGRYPRFLDPKRRREMYKSPYLYGGNIMIEARVAMKYKKDLIAAGRTPHAPTTGFFDIEMSLLKSSYGKLPLMVFTSENQVFLTMKQSFMNEIRNGRRVDVTVDDITKAAHEHLDPLID